MKFFIFLSLLSIPPALADVSPKVMRHAPTAEYDGKINTPTASAPKVSSNMGVTNLDDLPLPDVVHGGASHNLIYDIPIGGTFAYSRSRTSYERWAGSSKVYTGGATPLSNWEGSEYTYNPYTPDRPVVDPPDNRPDVPGPLGILTPPIVFKLSRKLRNRLK